MGSIIAGHELRAARRALHFTTRARMPEPRHDQHKASPASRRDLRPRALTRSRDGPVALSADQEPSSDLFTFPSLRPETRWNAA